MVIGLLATRLVCALATCALLLMPASYHDLKITLLRGLIWAVPVTFVLCVIVFLEWLYRAHRNLSSLGVEALEFSSGGAVGWWFMPFLNLYKPYRVMREVWLASNPAVVGDESERWGAEPSTPLLLAWWLSFLAANILHRIEMGMANAGTFNVGFAFLVELILFVPGLLLVVLVREIDKRQQQAYDKLCQLQDGSVLDAASS